MKFICGGVDLADAASKVLRATNQRGLMPIMEGIKVVAKNGFVEFIATDQELSIQKRITANTLIDGQVVVPGKLFCDFVKRLNHPSIEISVNANLRMVIKYGDNQSEIACMSADEFPEVDRVDNPQQVVLISSEFKDLISKVEFCCSMDDSRPILKGVLLEVEDFSISAVSLDGYRLAKCTKPIEKTTAKMTAVVPRRSLLEMTRLLEDTTEFCTIQFQKNHIKLDLDHTQVISRLLVGDFVNYRQIMPTNIVTTTTISRESFQDALERASLVSSKERTNLVKFNIAENKLEIVSNSQVGAVSENLVVNQEGPSISIAFNAVYFVQLLRVLNTQNIVVEFISNTTPTTVKPSSDDDVSYLVLPVRTN
ncbi:MAG: DNA polymerase III subunit beta [Firmicutes bacterium]|nr:DNA polymerase III subunit beta [Bacillota bacterium]MCL1954294.1 DNA polymerase III subunit beta [Bacillota bacterium]